MEKQDVEKEKRGELADCCELAPVSEGEEENDEDMLAACINIGMQNSRYLKCVQLVQFLSCEHYTGSNSQYRIWGLFSYKIKFEVLFLCYFYFSLLERITFSIRKLHLLRVTKTVSSSVVQSVF